MRTSRPWRLLVPLVAAAALLVGMTPVSASVALGTAPPSSDNGDGTFANPVVFADVPDVSVAFDGTAYYMVSTTMHMAPSLPIMRSTDMVNWSIAGYTAPILADTDGLALRNGANEYGRGTWASSIRFHGDTYYISVASQSTGKTYVYTTKNIENGPWTTSTLAGYLHDQSLMFDGEDLYFVYGAGSLLLRKLTRNADGTVAYAGAAVTLVNNANVNMTAGLNAEGAHAYKIGDYYYVFMIQWPSGGIRQEVLWRSRALTPQSEGGVWESKLILNQRGLVEGQSGGGIAQGGVVQAADGKWYAMLFQDMGPVGRSPHLVTVNWAADGWPEFTTSPTMSKPTGTVASPPTDIVVSDEFNSQATKAGYWNSVNDTAVVAGAADAYNGSNLKLQWQWNHNPDNRFWSTTERAGYLRLTTGSTATGILNAKNTLTQRTYGPTSSGVVSMDVSQMKNGDVAGMTALQRKYGYVAVQMVGGVKSLVMQRAASDGTVTSTSAAVPLTGNSVFLKIDANYKGFANSASFYYSLDGTAWTKIGDNLAMEYTLPHFMGYRFGLFNYATTTTGGYVDFDYFRVANTIGQGVATSQCTTAAVIIDNGGFESGSITPWIGNGTAQLTIVTDEKVSGTSSVLSTGRTKTDHGPRQPVAGELTPGASYAVSAKVKYTTGPASKQFYVTIQDSAFRSFNMAGASVPKGQWTTLTGTYTIPTTGLDLSTARVFVETAWTGTPDATNDLMDFWTDDVSMVGASAATFDGGLIDNGGYETGALTPWTGNGTAQLTLTTADKAGGACSVAVTGRTNTGDGPRQSVANELVAGTPYNVSAKVKYTTGPATKTFNIVVQDAAFRAFVMGTGTVTKGQWSTLTGTYTVPATGLDLTTARIFVETSYSATPNAANDLMDFWVDDVSVKAGRVKGTASPAKTVGNSNPLVDYQYGADPFAMVYDGRVYEYMTGDGTEIDATGKIVQKYETDTAGGIKDNSYGQIKGLNVISSADMVNWTNHGQVKVAGAQGLAKWANNSWAPSAAHKVVNGKEQFFLYFANSAGGIGVLQADSPVGPFRDPIGKALVTQSTPGVAGVVWLFDPAVLIDDDGSAYLYFGGGVPTGQTDHPNTGRVIKLGADMISTVGTAASIDAPALFEDAGINKIGDTYYYSYCSNFSHSANIDGHTIGSGTINYMTSSNPMGPFTYQAEIMQNPASVFGAGGNNHHAMFEFNDQMYMTYHTQMVQTALVAGAGLDKTHGYRSTNIDKVTINADGSIKPITMTYQGIGQQASLDPYRRTEAETIAWDSGIQDAYDATSGIRVEALGADNSVGQKLTNVNNGEWTSVSGVDFGSGGSSGATAITASVLPKAGGQIQIRLDSASAATTDNLVGTIDVPAGPATTWQDVTVALNRKVTGTHHVFFRYVGAGAGELFDVDHWAFTPAAASPSSTVLEAASAEVSTKESTTLSATVASDAAFSGTVELFDGATEVGSSPVVSVASGSSFAGTAMFSIPAGLSAGSHTYTAKFVSADVDAVTGSSSTAVPVTVYFWDRAPGGSFYTEISWLAEQGITTGVDGGGFDPGRLVDRQAMAAFLFRLLNPGQDAPECSVRPFSDVAITNQFCGEITWLAGTGVTAGYDDGTFRHATKIDRQAMAAFLYRLKHPGATRPTCLSAPFGDVPVSNQFCGEISWLKSTGITTGYEGNRFQPNEKVSRQSMAAFLYRLEHPAAPGAAGR